MTPPWHKVSSARLHPHLTSSSLSVVLPLPVWQRQRWWLAVASGGGGSGGSGGRGDSGVVSGGNWVYQKSCPSMWRLNGRVQSQASTHSDKAMALLHCACCGSPGGGSGGNTNLCPPPKSTKIGRINQPQQQRTMKPVAEGGGIG